LSVTRLSLIERFHYICSHSIGYFPNKFWVWSRCGSRGCNQHVPPPPFAKNLWDWSWNFQNCHKNLWNWP
jgi:hypothetical protein